ncbi:hypothetical protein [Methanobrevibacter sp.]|uniref:hypothetical protein n=1 Tax=Methanobrevibacter sp. TaxID=66852 RepID=UPI00262F4BBD|nr:hypothetical protein [uncultured Methanobrevibacter sp.]
MYPFFKFCESIEAEIIMRIWEKSGGKYTPEEIIKRKYTPNFRFLFRMEYIRLKRKSDEIEDLNN